jgi:hypothetical protein
MLPVPILFFLSQLSKNRTIKKSWVNYQFSTNFFLRTHSGYIPYNTPGGFGNASAPAVAATPHNAIERCILFYSIDDVEKNEILFFHSF